MFEKHYYFRDDFDAGKPLLVYGFGTTALADLPYLFDLDANIVAIFDQNPDYHGMFNGIPVLPPEDLAKFDKAYTVVVYALKAALHITAFLRELGFRDIKYGSAWVKMEIELCAALAGEEALKSNVMRIESAAEQIYRARNLMADKISLEVFDARLDGYKTGDWLKLANCNSYTKGFGYYNHGLFKFGGQEVFADCGALNGATAFEFKEYVKGKYKYIYSFEPSEIYFELTKRNFSYAELTNAKVYRYALCNQIGTVSFSTKNATTATHSIDPDGTETVPCTTLDHFFSKEKRIPTFIKMDIEGAELDALNGAAEVLKSAPRLAICAYHTLPHLWEVPLKIHELNPKYKLYYRHDSIFYETRCYAV